MSYREVIKLANRFLKYSQKYSFDMLEFKTNKHIWPPTTKAEIKFPNGYGACVIDTKGEYYFYALNADGDPINRGFGNLTKDGVSKLLNEFAELDPAGQDKSKGSKKYSFYTLYFKKFLDGVSATIEFPNGYGASVVRHFGSYGGSEGLYELAVLDSKGEFCNNTPITNDVLGNLTEDDVSKLLNEIAELNPATQNKSKSNESKSNVQYSFDSLNFKVSGSKKRATIKFPNGYGASVIQDTRTYGGDDYPYEYEGSYGGSGGLYELVVLGPDGNITYSTPIATDALGHLTEDDVSTILNDIANL